VASLDASSAGLLVNGNAFAAVGVIATRTFCTCVLNASTVQSP
jgi:hypothetical protein